MENYPKGIPLAFMSGLTFRLQTMETRAIMAPDQTPPFARNTPQKTLDSWKQIAGYLKRSERTVRRWEESEGLPVHRRGHHSQDTVFAYRHELDAWTKSLTRCPRYGVSLVSTDPSSAGNEYLAEHDAITRTMHRYVAGARAGDSSVMRPAFHPDATISGFCLGAEYSGSIEHVFEWVDENGPAPNIVARFARIEIIETIAVVHLEVQHWSGKLAGANANASDIFTLLKCGEQWMITHKLFHWHVIGPNQSIIQSTSRPGCRRQ